MTEREAIEKLKNMRLFMQIEDGKNECKFTEDDYKANEMAIQALEEIQQYRAIGTVEECGAAVEKQKAKKPQKTESEGYRYTDTYRCPNCGGNFSGTGIANYCYHCGQKIDWEGAERGEENE